MAKRKAISKGGTKAMMAFNHPDSKKNLKIKNEMQDRFVEKSRQVLVLLEEMQSDFLINQETGITKANAKKFKKAVERKIETMLAVWEQRADSFDL